jgi:hypothetical protein
MSSLEDQVRVLEMFPTGCRTGRGLDRGKLETIAEVAGLDTPMPEYKPLDKERTLGNAADWLRRLRHNDMDPNTADMSRSKP